MDISKIPFEVITKHIIPRGHQNRYTNNYIADVLINTKPATKKESAMARISYYHPRIKKYKFVTFYKYDGRLFLKLSNFNNEGTGYAISRKENSYITKLRGKTAEAIAEFAGNHFIKQYDWQHNSGEPIFYIDKVIENDR